MRDVTIKPLSELLREPRFRKWRPRPAPIFAGYDSPPTDDEIALARELFALLDDESKNWYRSSGRGDIFAGV
jgi:hypothetical protein